VVTPQRSGIRRTRKRIGRGKLRDVGSVEALTMNSEAMRSRAVDSRMDAIGNEIRITNLGAMEKMSRDRSCALDSCKGAAVTSLAQQDLCLNHFLSRCYEDLDRIDPRGRRYRTEAADCAAMRNFIEECSRKALEVSVRCESLTNLQRGRLLDIMLWAGELFLLLRTSPNGLRERSASSESLREPRMALPNS
jgi:hypothetical protein